jgi:SulP family sulfate permease
MLFLSPIVSLIPLAALAAVLFVVAWNMSELKHFTHLLLRAPIGDRGVLFVSFTLTVFVDITMAITVGMIVALFLFMRRLSEVSKLSFLDLTTTQESAATKVPEGVQVYEINGPFFFGTADMLRDLAGLNPKAFILRMRSVPVIDASGVFALKEFVQMCDRSKIELFLCDVQPDVQKDLRRLHVIGEGRIKATLGAALKELTDRIV